MWYPPDYYALDAVERFISIVQNHKADTVKEMVRVYDEEGYRNSVLSNQQEMNAKMEQSLCNQQQMMRLQHEANVLALGNMVANLATAANTSKIADNTAATAANTARTAFAVDSMSRDADALARKFRAKS